MKTKFTLPLAFVLIQFTMQSCFSPQNIVKLEPEKEAGKWRYGQQFVTDSLNGIVYEVGYEQLRDNLYWFDFNITNRSNIPILIDPATISCRAFDGFKNPNTEKRVYAIDPESEILALEKELAITEAREVNHVGLSLLAASVDIASGVAVATDENPHNNHMHTHLFHEVQRARVENEFKAGSLDEMMDAWKNSTIRKTTLEPNYQIQGKVFLPAFREAAYIKLYLPVDEKNIELSFKQIQYPVK